jgi:hypothetical protein
VPAHAAGTPASLLVRIGRLPEPLAYPPLEFAGAGRYDDPEGSYRVLYLAESLKTCYIELFANQRPSLQALAMRSLLPPGEPGDHEPALGRIPRDWLLRWCEERAIGRIALVPDQRWLDLYAAETHRELRSKLAPLLHDLNIGDFDFGDVLSRNRRLSQAVSRWAFQAGFRGIVFPSRFHYELRCWALFETARFRRLDIVPVDPDSAELQAALSFHGLAVLQ